MKKLLGAIALGLALGSPLGAEGRWGLGVEVEGRWFHQDYEGAGLRLSGSGELRVTGPFWVGLRGTLGLWGPGGPWSILPRANLALGWELSPDLTVEVEAPYSPGLGVLLFGHWYLAVGTDELLVLKDYVTRTAVVEYRW